jgi:hypothetical protein
VRAAKLPLELHWELIRGDQDPLRDEIQYNFGGVQAGKQTEEGCEDLGGFLSLSWQTEALRKRLRWRLNAAWTFP